MIDTNKLLQEHGYRTSRNNYGEIARQAAYYAKLGHPKDLILRKIDNEYGGPEERMTMEPIDGKPLSIIGDHLIPENAKEQMRKALSLPVATRGALMPDAHLGYGLPVGGVLAMDNAISPGFVGFDIGCRMKMSILNIPPEQLDDETKRQYFLHDMKAVSSFGLGSNFGKGEKRDHEVMEDPLWNEIHYLKQLKNKAYSQLGSSGGGNHFFDLMQGRVFANSELLPNNLKPGDTFTAIVTHSGSRGTGHKVATHYVKLAKQYMKEVAEGIPHNYEWLSMDSEAGQEYWEAMQLMGRYAQANHDLIHEHFIRKVNAEVIADYDNHHNFAWKGDDGEIIHRKGATPADEGIAGLIPGSCSSPSYLVEGLGSEEYMNSCSHGAGRTKSRTQAKEDVDKEQHNRTVDHLGITTHGVNWDETDQSYKSIYDVIAQQDGKLVNAVAAMFPKVVIMGGKSDDGD